MTWKHQQTHPDGNPSTDTTASADDQAQITLNSRLRDHGRRNRVVINLMPVATFVVFLNETSIGLAIPDLIIEQRIPASTVQWLSTAFILTRAVVIPITGFPMTRFSARTDFALEMTFFNGRPRDLGPHFECVRSAEDLHPRASRRARCVGSRSREGRKCDPTPHGRGRRLHGRIFGVRLRRPNLRALASR